MEKNNNNLGTRNKRFVRSGPNKRRGQKPKVKPEYDQKILDIARVSRVTSGGRRFNFRVTMVVGNRSGKVGVAIGRGKDVAIAVNKATRNAQKNIFFAPLTPEGTIPHATEGKKCSAKVMMMPTKSGRGIIAGGPVRIICELAGYKDLSAKIIGRTTNKLNNALATIDALQNINYTPSEKPRKKEKPKETKEDKKDKK